MMPPKSSTVVIQTSLFMALVDFLCMTVNGINQKQTVEYRAMIPRFHVAIIGLTHNRSDREFNELQ
jgi:hypothetical protein